MTTVVRTVRLPRALLLDITGSSPLAFEGKAVCQSSDWTSGLSRACFSSQTSCSSSASSPRTWRTDFNRVLVPLINLRTSAWGTQPDVRDNIDLLGVLFLHALSISGRVNSGLLPREVLPHSPHRPDNEIHVAMAKPRPPTSWSTHARGGYFNDMLQNYSLSKKWFHSIQTTAFPQTSVSDGAPCPRARCLTRGYISNWLLSVENIEQVLTIL